MIESFQIHLDRKTIFTYLLQTLAYHHKKIVVARYTTLKRTDMKRDRLSRQCKMYNGPRPIYCLSCNACKFILNKYGRSSISIKISCLTYVSNDIDLQNLCTRITD